MLGGNIVVRLGADLTNFNSGLTRGEAKLRGFGGLAKKALGGVGLGFVAAGLASLKAAGDYEQALNVFQAVSKATGGQMKQVSSLAKALGNDMSLPATSARDAADAMTELAKGGLSVKNTMSAAKGVLQLSAAAQIANADAATITARALNSFKLSGDQAIHVADVLANAANKSSGEITDFALGLQQSSSVAHQTGLSIEDTTAALMEMAQAGIVGSDAGTSLKTMLMRLIPQSKQARDAMHSLGVDVFDSQGKFVGIRAAIDQYHDGLAKLTPEQRQMALQTIFGSDAIRGANIVLGEGVGAFDRYRDAANQSGSAQDLAQAKMKGFKGALEGFKSVLETLAINVGETLLPVATEAAHGLAKALDENGPAITRFAQQAAAEIPRIASALKDVGRVGFDVGRFFTTDWGASIATFVATNLVLISAASAVMTKFSALKLALAGINPVWAIAGIAVSGFTAMLVYNRMQTSETEQAYRRATDALDNFKNASERGTSETLNLRDAQVQVKQATLDVQTATQRKTQVDKDAHATVSMRKQAELDLERSLLSQQRAQDNVRDATRRATEANRDATAASDNAKAAVGNLRADFEKITSSLGMYREVGRTAIFTTDEQRDAFKRTKAAEFAADLEKVAAKAKGVADANRIAHPEIAATADAIRRQALATVALTKRLGEIPAAIVSVKGQAASNADAIGRAIQSGVLAGSDGLGAALGAKLSASITAAVAQAKGHARIKSPSGLTRDEIGKPLGEGVIVGWLTGSAQLPSAMKQKLRDAIEQGRQLIESKRAVFSNAFGRVTDRIFKAFDTQTSAHLTPAGGRLASISDRRRTEDATQAVADAEQNLADVRASGDATAADIAAAERQLARAREDITVLSLEKQAADERTNYESRRENLRVHLEDRLVSIKAHFEKEGGTVGELTKKITGILGSYDLDFANVGELLGQAFVRGLKGAIKAAGAGATAVEQTIDSVAGSITIGKVKGLASGGIVRARPGGTLFNLGEGGRDEAVVPLGGGGGGGGGNVVFGPGSIVVQGSLIHENQLQSVIIDAIRNYRGGPLFSRTAGVAV